LQHRSRPSECGESGCNDLAAKVNYSIEGPRVRLAWAAHHLKEFDHEADKFLARLNTATISRRRNPKDGSYVFRVKVVRPPTPELTLRVVDCVNHLRSSLDNLMWQLGVRYGNSRQRRSATFPVCTTEKRWKEREPTLLRYLPEEVVARIQMNQPYRAEEHGYKHTEHVAWFLNKRWNNDKHRIVEPLRFIVESAVFGPHEFGDDAIIYPRVADGAPIAKVFTNWRLSPAEEERLHSSFVFGIGFGPKAGDAWSVSRTLHEIHAMLSKQTLPLFEPFLTPP
jgi:hypothetical protein